jgi:5-methyltetrahydropteroyltriglutamate--homocysteine methyltransferase
VCRGNWSRDEGTLLRGSYDPLLSTFERMRVDQFVLEYATERAGDLLALPGREIGLGVVNPRIDRVETPEEICASLERAFALYPKERVFLNPDCGFGTFSNRPMNDAQRARAKLESMVSAASRLR